MAEDEATELPASMGKTVSRKKLGRPAPLDRRRLTIDRRIDAMKDDDEHHVCRHAHPAQEPFTPGAVVSIWGQATTEKDVFQPYFSEKAINYDGNDQFSHLPHSVGLLCQRGHKPDSPNQDDFFVVARQEWLIFGVLDGHGPSGHHVSHCVQEHLPRFLLDKLKVSADDWTGSASAAFQDMTTKLGDVLGEQVATSGSTASVALLSRGVDGKGPLRLRCAFIGDSAIVHGFSDPTTSSWEARQVSDIHRPDREDEYERILKVGGKVMASPGPGMPPRLLTQYLDLAMSRSFGDFYARDEGLVSEPEVPPEIILDESLDHIILICSDGIWDVIPPMQAVQLVSKFKPSESQKAVEKLVAKAQHRWQEQDFGGVVDDITVILVRPGFAPVVATSAEVSGDGDDT